jgi:hypothetical protein
MCVDYTDLNRHCSKDPFALPCIDQVIDSTASHQIALKEEDQIKIALITPFGAYAYTTRSFELKNAGAMYQRAILVCLADQLHGKSMWRTWSSRLESTMSSSPTSRKPSTVCADSHGSSTRLSASSAYRKGNYSVLSSVTKELKLT